MYKIVYCSLVYNYKKRNDRYPSIGERIIVSINKGLQYKKKNETRIDILTWMNPHDRCSVKKEWHKYNMLFI